MTFDFTVRPEVEDWRGRIQTFVDEQVVPFEQQAFEHGVDDDLRRTLQAAAKQACVWAPQAPLEYGGGGFRFDEVSILLEEAGRSLLGPLAMNCAAPDEGNIHLLAQVATEGQKDRFLRPLVDGAVRSCFAMTEPPPGAGSDPSALRTHARRVDGGWLVNGEKHLITGADGAGFCILMARGGSDDGATMFLVDADADGFTVAEHARTLDATMVGGHCRVVVDDLFVPDDRVLGEPGRGFAYAQVRLAPARMTHCMRWLGAARRAHEIALDRAIDRSLFGSKLADLGQAQAMIADNEIDLAASRALMWQTCWQLAAGNKGTEESSRAKVFISEATCRIVDRSVQLAGGLGTSDDLVIGRIYGDIRAFRIYDGSSETHRMSIAKRAARRAQQRRA
ncbi:MAG: acyl-CoA dehydrogenase family protein [Actinomycetota bacterium]|nr:acyl-CoA dehydrogenase family protein [Actinomycetota bacterium]